MSQLFDIDPANPQLRLVCRAAEIVRAGGVIAYPTDSSYAFGCAIGDKNGMERIRRIRRLGAGHNFTLVCPNLADLSLYAKVDNTAYRLMQALIPGPYTFILQATRRAPRRLQHPKRKTVGLRVPAHAIARALTLELGEPLMSVTLRLADDDPPLNDGWTIRERLGNQIDAVVESGPCAGEPTTVVDLSDGVVRLVREGRGDISVFTR